MVMIIDEFETLDSLIIVKVCSRARACVRSIGNCIAVKETTNQVGVGKKNLSRENKKQQMPRAEKTKIPTNISNEL